MADTKDLPSLSELDKLSRVYASSYASPHHVTFTVEGLRNMLAELLGGSAAAPAATASPDARDALTKPLPTPVPMHCCGDRLLPCKKCGADVWKSEGDRDCSDWDEEVFSCQHCGNCIHVELPD